VASFADRSEAEALRAELQSMRDSMRAPAAKAA